MCGINSVAEIIKKGANANLRSFEFAVEAPKSVPSVSCARFDEQSTDLLIRIQFQTQNHSMKSIDPDAYQVSP